ncbi:MAG: type II secretion system F family protein, partial [Planctomycetota bacterium]
GVLDQVLARLADFLERSQGLRDRTRGALAYPLVVFLVAVLVISILTIFVIPKFSALFTDMDLEIPLATRILMDMSAFMQHWWFLVLGLPVLFGIFYQTLYLRAFRFRRWNHRMILRLPLLGSLVRMAQIARFSATFGTLVASGVPHLRGFEITRGALSNELYREAMEEVREQVREGESIAASLAATERFDDVVVSMVEVGEQTGALDNMCLRLGANYEQNYKRSLDVLLRLLEPFMLIVMAVLVGTIALAMFLPLFKLIEQFGKPV